MTNRRTTRALLQTGAAVVLLAVVIARFGVAPIVDGLRQIDGYAIAAAVLIGAVTTFCCALRWRVVARGMGVDVGLLPAVAAYYRSIFLNSTLPGGLVGDVHRAIRHGRDVDDVGRGARSVAWDRIAGQAVQILLTVAVLALMPSPARHWMPVLVAAIAVCALAVVIAVRSGHERGSSRLSRAIVAARSDLRTGVLRRAAWPVIVLTSVLVVVGHATVFLIAARTVNADAAIGTLIPVALIVLAAMSLPLNVAGWGLREGAAAWAFGAVGLGATIGLSAAVVYGVLSLAAAAPGAVVITVSGLGSIQTKEVVHG